MAGRLLTSLALIAGFALGGGPAAASNCALDDYDHNGSLMQIQICDGGAMTISYLRPRQGIARQGVRSGTLLFNGVEQANGVMTGQARLFDARCGEIAYQVSGPKQGNRIVLRGSAPIRDRNCRIVRQRADTLVFTLQAAAPGVVRPSCPPGYVLANGQCVLAGGQGQGQNQGQNQGQGGAWYAIAGSFRAQGPAQARATSLGPGWGAMNTNQCPNMTNGYWVASIGPSSQAQAEAAAAQAGRHGAYAKSCY